MKRFQKIALFLIILASFILRVWQVGRVPTFISDEASIGYNAFSLLKTGKDEWGNFIPFSFKSFGEYKLPLYIWTTVLPVSLFGLSEFSTRLSSILAGTFSCFLIFLLGKRLFSTEVGLWAALFLAFNPWHIEVSRLALEANLALFFVLLGMYFLTFASEKRQSLYLSFFFFGLSLWTYNTCRVFVPLFLFFLFLSERKNWGKVFQKDWQAFLIILAFSLPIFLSGFQGSKERLFKVGIFSDPGIVTSIEEKRGLCLEKNSFFWCRLYYNRPVTFSLVFAKNFLSHFSPKYLFLEGSNLAQYQIPKTGSFYFFEGGLWIFAFFWFLKRKERKALVFLSLWVLVAPLANSLTGLAHPVRALVILPVFSILSGLGVNCLLGLVSKKQKVFASFLILLLVFWFSSKFLLSYFLDYPRKVGATWQEGYKLLYQKLAQKEDGFDKIMVTKFYGEPHIFYLFYRKIDPLFYLQDQSVIRYTRSDGWVNVDRIGKYYFFDKQIEVEGKVLYAVTPEEKGENFEVLDQVTWKNGQISFLIGQPK